MDGQTDGNLFILLFFFFISASYLFSSSSGLLFFYNHGGLLSPFSFLSVSPHPPVVICPAPLQVESDDSSLDGYLVLDFTRRKEKHKKTKRLSLQTAF